MRIIREDGLGNVMYEIDGKFYIVYEEGNQVFSTLPCDLPRDGGLWVSRATEKGVRYVAHGKSRSAAYSQWRKHILRADENL